MAVTALTAFAVILGVTGPNLAHAYAASGLASCRGNCTSLSGTFLSQVNPTPSTRCCTWWSGPIDQAGGFPVTMGQLSRFSPLVFDARGFAPVGYAAFAFILGVTVGVLTRRTAGRHSWLGVALAEQVGTDPQEHGGVDQCYTELRPLRPQVRVVLADGH